MSTAYEALLEDVLVRGEERKDRTGVGTYSIFSAAMAFDLSEGRVPLISSKKVAWKKALEELLWMIRGETNVNGLGTAKNIWAPWADADGNLGPVYGKQYRDAGGVDQLADVVRLLTEDPWSRRIIMNLWNVGELDEMALPPCPVLYQWSVRDGGVLDLNVYQRSADVFLGVPFDIFEFAVLTHLLAGEAGLTAGKMVVMLGDAHVYLNHEHAVMEQLSRDVSDKDWPRLVMALDRPGLLSGELTVDHFNLVGYNPHPAISAPVAV